MSGPIRLLVWGAWALAAVAGVVAVVLRWVDPAPVVENTFGVGDASVLVFAQLGFVWATVGAILVDRRPSNLVGTLMLVTGVGYALSALSPAVLFSAAARSGEVPNLVESWAAWATGLGTMVTALGFIVALIFPTGRGQTSAWDHALQGLLVFAAVWIALIVTQPGPSHLIPGVENPLGIGLDLRPWLGPRSSLVLVTVATIVGLPIVGWSLISRYRSADHTERLQLRWFAWSVGLSLGALLLLAVGAVIGNRDLGEGPIVAFGLVTTSIPIAIAIAILRYHLYDIDRIISRTISYAVITSILVVVYVGAILIIQGPLGSVTGGDAIPVALSTLAVAALFQPVRRRVQRTIDRRFDRARFDGERTAAAFSERLRNETDMQRVVGDLARTAEATVAPTSLSIWLRSEGLPR